MFEIIKQLKQKGVTIIYISHRLEEVFRISDRVSVMRDGRYVATKSDQRYQPERTDQFNGRS